MGFKKFLFFEISRLTTFRKALVLLLFFLFSIYFIQSGIVQYKENLGEKDHFQEFEKIRVENFQFYAQYGTYGFRLLFIPGPLSALFSNAGIIHTNLNAFIDAGERMKIYQSFKGKNAFIGYTSIFLNLNGFILLFYSLLILFYGLESYQNSDFLKLLGYKVSRKRLFLGIFLSRLFLLFAWCLLISLTAWLLYLLNGITGINMGILTFYCLIVFFMLSFFLILGMLFGTLKNRIFKILIVFSVWFMFVFFFPAVIGKIVYNRAENITSTYDMEIEKFKLLMRFEKKAKDQDGKLDVEKSNSEIRQNLFKYLLGNEFKDILLQEQTMINEMKSVVHLHINCRCSFQLPSSYLQIMK